MMDMLYFLLSTILFCVLNLFSFRANKIEMNKSAQSKRLLKKNVG